MQDKEDDVRVGVKSTALRFGDSTKEWISGFGAACTGSLALSGYNANLGMLFYSFFSECICPHLHSFSLLIGAEWPYYVFLAAASTQLAWQIFAVDLSNRADCNRKWVPEYFELVISEFF